MENKRPDVAVAVIAFKDGKVLMCERNTVGDDSTWFSFPGGRMEFGESFKETALREIKEESGLDIDIKNETPVFVLNEILSDEKHHVTLFFEAEHVSGEPEILEPDKFKEWIWLDWNELPIDKLSPQAKNVLKTGYKPNKY